MDPGSLSLWERVGVRAAAVDIQGPVLSTSVALTPTLSQREREQCRSVWLESACPDGAPKTKAGPGEPWSWAPLPLGEGWGEGCGR